MPWHLERKEGKVCVIKDSDGSTAGCHGSRADAVKQMRALYSNESRTAAMYAELDAQPDYGWEEQAEKVEAKVLTDSTLSPFAAELVGLILKDEREKSLTASLAQSMEAISERMLLEREERGALVAALSQIGQPVINVPAAEVSVNVPPAEVKVNVEAPNIPAPEIRVDVPAPNVTVTPDIQVNLPSASKTVTFERDPLTGQVSKAEVVEG